MRFIPLHEHLLRCNPTLIHALWRECTPKVLVVTDGLNYDPNDGFGLTQFVQSLKTATIHGMTPIVVTASRGADPFADRPNYDFTNATHGLLKARYDVLFLLGIDSRFDAASPGGLPAPQVERIAQFMAAGGGVFATGDHSTLGAALCGEIPRVRSMRRWFVAGASGTPENPPEMSSPLRISTNLSGDDETEEFVDQSDRHPQRLYVNFRSAAGGIGNPHPLMQLAAPRRVVEVFPDHPHEGECVVPANLTTPWPFGGGDEWPADASGVRVAPEVVATSVSHGDGFPGKQALAPKMFAAVVAYDGQLVNTGRVSTDSTWHHFVNINLDGTGAGTTALQDAMGNDTDALVRIRGYYRNLASWLMPANVRLCLRLPRIVLELKRYPLFEELQLPRIDEADADTLRDAGAQVAASLGARLPQWEAQAIIDDTLDEVIGRDARLRLGGAQRVLGPSVADLGHAALGGFVTGVATMLAELKEPEQIKPHETFEPLALQYAKRAVSLLLEQRRIDFDRASKLLDRMGSEMRR